MTDEGIHSCGYHCVNPQCVIAQRDDLRARYFTLLEETDKQGKNSSDDFRARLVAAIERMPFGDTAASFAVFVRDFR